MAPEYIPLLIRAADLISSYSMKSKTLNGTSGVVFVSVGNAILTPVSNCRKKATAPVST
ncbi:MAG: hypothetical protein ACJATW_000594 [Glaciecola sp.]|jgi:hypothetical protein